MLKFFQRQSDAQLQTDLIRDFLTDSNHRWIMQDRNFREKLVDLFLALTIPELRQLLQKRSLLLLRSDGRFSCTIVKEAGREVVIVYPDLVKLMESAEFRQGQAILAHEFGHVLLDHNTKMMTEAQAQSEADGFAAKLGYGEELGLALSHFPRTKEIHERIQALIGPF